MNAVTGHGQPKPALRRRGQLLLVLSVLALFVAVSSGLWLYHVPPAYVQQHENFLRETSPEDLAGMASTLESQITRLQSYQGSSPGQSREDGGDDPTPTGSGGDLETRTIRWSIDEANAWLATKLPKWLANQRLELPVELSQPMLDIEGSDLVVAFRWRARGIDNTFSLVVGFEMTDEGQLRVQRRALRGGRLRLPSGMVTARLRSVLSEEAHETLEHLAVLLEGKPVEPVIPYLGHASGNQELRLVKHRIEEDWIELTFVLVPRRED